MRLLLLALISGCVVARSPDPVAAYPQDAPAARIDPRDAVVYGVVPFFFGEQGFDDVTARLDDLHALGVNVLWLSPVAAAPEDDFGYAIVDHMRLRDTFGSEEDLTELIQGAHARDMAVILDLAVNHTSDEHPWFVAAQADPTSPWRDYYEWDGDQHAYYFDWENLPNLAYGEPAVRGTMLQALRWWIERFDIDGYRLDAIWGVQERASGWVAGVREALGPDQLLIAEASVRDGVWGEMGFDAAYDWTDELGVWAWTGAFDDPMRTASLLREVIDPDPEVLPLRFLDNNDTGTRFAVRYGPERTRVAAALLMTLPGIPVVYTGTEVGADLAVYAEGPPLDWADPHDLRATWTEWIGLRHTHPALRRGDLAWVDAEDPVLAYWRRVEGPGDLLVALNFDEVPASLPGQEVPLVDVRTGEWVPPGQALQLPPHGALLLEAQQDLLPGE